jgi:hypothetical protein
VATGSGAVWTAGRPGQPGSGDHPGRVASGVVDDRAGRRRLDRTGRRLAVIESLGFAILVFAAAQVYGDPWRAIGGIGVGLIWVCQLIDRRTRPG